MAERPELMLDEKYQKVLDEDLDLRTRVEKLVDSFKEIGSTTLRNNMSESITDTVKKIIKEKYPDI